MFKLNLSKSFKWPVKFTLVDENGRQQQHEIPFVFKRVSAEESRQLLVDVQQDEKDRKALEDDGMGLSPRAQVEAETDALLKIIVGWDGVDIEGSTEFNRDNLIKLINGVPNLIGEIWAAFFAASTGGQKRKN